MKYIKKYIIALLDIVGYMTIDLFMPIKSGMPLPHQISLYLYKISVSIAAVSLSVLYFLPEPVIIKVSPVSPLVDPTVSEPYPTRDDLGDISDMLTQIGVDADIYTAEAKDLRDSKHTLGWLSAAKESRGRADTISTGRVGKTGYDRGGVSYGKHQIASKTGTMQNFLDSDEASPYSVLRVYPINSKRFKTQWRAYSKMDAFQKVQFDFLKRTHYDKPFNYAASRGFNTRSPLIQEAIFSMGIHSGAGGWNKKRRKYTGAFGIIKAVADHNDIESMSVDQQVQKLYVARWLRTRKSVVSKRHYSIRMKRYKSEYSMLMKWKGQETKTYLSLR